MGVDATFEYSFRNIGSAAEDSCHSSHEISAENAVIRDMPSSYLSGRDLHRRKGLQGRRILVLHLPTHVHRCSKVLHPTRSLLVVRLHFKKCTVGWTPKSPWRNKHVVDRVLDLCGNFRKRKGMPAPCRGKGIDGGGSAT